MHVGGGWKSNYSDTLKYCNSCMSYSASSRQLDGALGSRSRISFPAGTAAHYCRSLPGQRQAGERMCRSVVILVSVFNDFNTGTSKH